MGRSVGRQVRWVQRRPLARSRLTVQRVQQAHWAARRLPEAQQKHPPETPPEARQAHHPRRRTRTAAHPQAARPPRHPAADPAADLAYLLAGQPFPPVGQPCPSEDQPHPPVGLACPRAGRSGLGRLRRRGSRRMGCSDGSVGMEEEDGGREEGRTDPKGARVASVREKDVSRAKMLRVHG